MTLLEKLANRYSTPQLEAPAPAPEEIEVAYQAMMRVPDHARLKPWRLEIWQDDGLVRLGQIFAEAAAELEPETSEAQLQRFKNLPLRAPMIAMVVATHTEHPKVPFEEQTITAGCAVYAMMLVLGELGYGCMWRTGQFAYMEPVKRALKLADNEAIVGYLYVGTPGSKAMPTDVPPEFTDKVTFITT